MLITLGVLTGCGGTEPEPLIDVVYDVVFDPALATSTGGSCDRFLTRVLLTLRRHGTFELTLNVIDRCPNLTYQWRYFAIDANGGYYRDADSIDFLPNPSRFPRYVSNERGIEIDTLPGLGLSQFSGRLEGDFLQLTLTPEFEVARIPLEVRVGPGEPY